MGLTKILSAEIGGNDSMVYIKKAVVNAVDIYLNNNPAILNSDIESSIEELVKGKFKIPRPRAGYSVYHTNTMNPFLKGTKRFRSMKLLAALSWVNDLDDYTVRISTGTGLSVSPRIVFFKEKDQLHEYLSNMFEEENRAVEFTLRTPQY